MKVSVFSVGEESISKAQLRLTDIAENLESDWIKLAEQLGITPEEIAQIQREYHYVVEQVGKNGTWQWSTVFLLDVPQLDVFSVC